MPVRKASPALYSQLKMQAETDRQADMQTDRQTCRQTDRLTRQHRVTDKNTKSIRMAHRKEQKRHARQKGEPSII